MERIQKYLSNKGICSRREAERLIEQRRVKVNNRIINLGKKIDGSEKITIDDVSIKPKKSEYFLLNKPKGYLSSVVDYKKGKPIIDLIETDSYIFPVGRLDVNTTGLIFLTNDGEFASQLNSPSSNISKTYLAKINTSSLTQEELKKLREGLIIEGGYKTKPAIQVEVIKKNSNSCKVKIVLKEGKKNQIKKMFNAIGYEVLKLHRSKIGNIDENILKNKQYIVLSLNKIFDLL